VLDLKDVEVYRVEAQKGDQPVLEVVALLILLLVELELDDRV